METLTIASQINWEYAAESGFDPIPTVRENFIVDAMTRQETDGLVTILIANYDQPTSGWTKWINTDVANAYVQAIVDAAATANVANVTTSLVPISSIPTENVKYTQY